MYLCDDCIHLIEAAYKGFVWCEAHEFSTRCKIKCRAYLHRECNDEEQIRRSNIIAQNILLDEYEKIVAG